MWESLAVCRQYSSQNAWYSSMPRMCSPCCCSEGWSAAALRLFGRGVVLQDAFEGLVGRLRQGEHLLARPLDILALVMPCEVGEAVDGVLSRAAQAGEDLAGQLRAVRPDLGHLADQARRLAGGIEDAVFLGQDEVALARGLSCRRRSCPCCRGSRSRARRCAPSTSQYSGAGSAA